MSRYIVDDIGAVVERMRGITIQYGQPMLDYLDDNNMSASNRLLALFYMYGHRMEISNRLKAMVTDKERKYQKYPLIALRLDIPEPTENSIAELNLNIAILAYTDKTWNAEQRMENVFKPVLYPLYDRFMKELRTSGMFFWQGDPIPKHTKIDRPFWGIQGEEGNEKFIFNDPLDAIEIIDLNIFKKIKC